MSDAVTARVGSFYGTSGVMLVMTWLSNQSIIMFNRFVMML